METKLEELTSRTVTGKDAAIQLAAHAIRSSALVRVTPLPGDHYEVSVRVDRADVLKMIGGKWLDRHAVVDQIVRDLDAEGRASVVCGWPGRNDYTIRQWLLLWAQKC